MYSSTSPYAYEVNNPVMLIDPDGRKIYDSPIMEWSAGLTEDSFMNMNGYNRRDFNRRGGTGGGGLASANMYGNINGGGYTGSGLTFGQTQAYQDLMAGLTSSISFSNGYMKYWTGGTGDKWMGTITNDGADLYGDPRIMHSIRIGDNSTSGGNYWSFLNDASSVQAKTDFAIGSTLGLADQIAGDLLNSGKMIKASNPFNLYNLRRVNGALNGNRYISANKFISRARMLRYVSDSKVVKGVSYLGLGLSVAQFYESHHPGYISRGIIGFLAGNIPYLGPAIAMGIDQTNVDYWNIWTMLDEIQGTHKYDNY